MRIVERIEHKIHKTGWGIFWPETKKIHQIQVRRFQSFALTPKEHRFAYPSLEDMELWLCKYDRELLHKNGFVHRTYRAYVLMDWGEQLVFDPIDAELIAEHSLLEKKEWETIFHHKVN